MNCEGIEVKLMFRDKTHMWGVGGDMSEELMSNPHVNNDQLSFKCKIIARLGETECYELV